MKISEYVSNLDSERFGFTVAKINNFSQSPAATINALKKDNVKLIISKINCENLTLINQLECLGFQTKDFQVTYRYDIKNIGFSAADLQSEFIVREVQNNDIPTIANIAQVSFENYGHYFANKNLDPSRCREIYKDWAERSCTSKDVADRVLVADQNGTIAGFLSFKCYTENGKRYAAGGLGAVAPEYRNKNVFRLLVKTGLLWGKEGGLNWEEHNVLTTNYPVNRAFTKIGFTVFKSFVTLHHWNG